MKDNFLSTIWGIILTGVTAFFEPTATFLVALLAGFFFNIMAGFRADEVKITLHRIFPPMFIFKNFQGNKFKDSLMELFLIAGVTYFIRGILGLFHFTSYGDFAVQWLLIIAVYVYFRNGLKNLHKAYPKIKFIQILYVLLSFKFREIVGGDVADIIEKEENK